MERYDGILEEGRALRSRNDRVNVMKRRNIIWSRCYFMKFSPSLSLSSHSIAQNGEDIKPTNAFNFTECFSHAIEYWEKKWKQHALRNIFYAWIFKLSDKKMYKTNISVENGEEEKYSFRVFRCGKQMRQTFFIFLRIYLFNLFGWAEDAHAVDSRTVKKELTI